MDDDIRILEQDYCPPLDPALVHAIYSDFSDQTDSIQLARELLDGLKQAAAAEQFTDFDPSGSSGDAVRSSPSKQGSDDAESNAETWTTQTTVTDCTSLSSDLATLSLGGGPGSSSEESLNGGYFRDTEGFDTPTKELVLAETFPTLRPDLVAYTLKKCAGDFEKATDELLNHVYFEDERASPDEETPATKGIDAFSEEYHVPQRGRKGKGKRRQKNTSFYNHSSASGSGSDLPATPPTNRWAEGGRDVEFLSSRTKLPSKAVASLYHKNGASLPGTIIAVINKDIASHEKEEPDAALVQPAIELTAEFPNVDLEYAIALIRLTAPSTANAHELAKALTMYPRTPTSRGGVAVIPRYAPVNLSEASTPDSQRLSSLPPAAIVPTAASLTAARNVAFTQASSAYRKGKSNPLMKAAAGYYSQVGRDYNANLQAMNESDADALVASQSTPTLLDLHGVSVHNATRIAKAKTQAWWDGLGEQRIPGGGRRGVGEGYTIVTGLGRHSEGGRAKLGPAVVRALVREGWKVEVGSGELAVMGIARRK